MLGHRDVLQHVEEGGRQADSGRLGLFCELSKGLGVQAQGGLRVVLVLDHLPEPRPDTRDPVLLPPRLRHPQRLLQLPPRRPQLLRLAVCPPRVGQRQHPQPVHPGVLRWEVWEHLHHRLVQLAGIGKRTLLPLCIAQQAQALGHLDHSLGGVERHPEHRPQDVGGGLGLPQRQEKSSQLVPSSEHLLPSILPLHRVRLPHPPPQLRHRPVQRPLARKLARPPQVGVVVPIHGADAAVWGSPLGNREVLQRAVGRGVGRAGPGELPGPREHRGEHASDHDHGGSQPERPGARHQRNNGCKHRDFGNE
mmetsp:Transcript_112894/g.258525  ORF Transcript_112894/g.258525 Transcript_112894/m.258525 type:complete len:307 (-) Transcript_112894:14-934(-)